MATMLKKFSVKELKKSVLKNIGTKGNTSVLNNFSVKEFKKSVLKNIAKKAMFVLFI